ncbi:sensor histidine kinase [Halobacteriales archaeon QH_2_66_30]|nr:MAG: sensor histidine kinase [Halobacteriales archaeon QH_2_66_30]
MIEGNDCRDAVSIDRYPGPVCSYTCRNGEPVIERANEAFEEAFGPVAAGDALAPVFEEYGIEPIDGPAPLSATMDEDRTQQVRVESPPERAAGANRYLAQVIAPDGERPGHLLMTDASAGAGDFGVDGVASVISHDLRNPLDVAKARLRAGRELDSGEDHLEHVEQAHDRMERIIQDVLTLARGEEVIEPEGTVGLGAVAEDAWETVETNGASLSVTDSLPSTVADRDRVKRLFENLFRNAMEHGSTSRQPPADDAVEHGSTGGQPSADNDDEHDSDEITITVGRIEDGTTGFYVADDGRGIPVDRREAVFRPGYSSDEHGTGLGLAIVRRIADVHGWSVSVTNAAGGGARFEFVGVEPA